MIYLPTYSTPLLSKLLWQCQPLGLSLRIPTANLNMPSTTNRISYFSPSLCRFPPRLLYWIFIPADVVCLVLQGAGGALSTVSSGSSAVGVDLALAGLSLQVIAMVAFSAIFGDYLLRYVALESGRRRAGQAGDDGGRGGDDDDDDNGAAFVTRLTPRIKVFFGFMAAAVLFILARCAYRVAELHQGYSGSLIREQGLFIGLEGV